MTTGNAGAALSFDAPDGRFWERDPVHFPRPVTRYWSEVHPASFHRGTSEMCRNYGLLLGGLDCTYLNGFAYNGAFPAPEEEIPARLQRAAEALEEKFWRKQLEEWEGTWKPRAIGLHREIQAVDPDALSDDELVAYLQRCRDHHSEMIYQHMRFTASAVIPTGDYLAHVGDWTGLPHSELLGVFRGASPVSGGGSVELERLLDAFAKDASAAELLASDGDPATVLAELRALPNATGDAVGAYLDLVGNRLLDGFDISNPRAIELPDALLRAIRSAVATGGAESVDLESLAAPIRERVPAEHRAAFDELLGEARLTYRLRDERGVFSDIWASGLMRRAVLAAGARLAARGRIDAAEHLLDAGFDEMVALVTGKAGPTGAELAERQAVRTGMTGKEAPMSLGTPHPPPDPSGLPPAAGRLMRATGVALGHLFGSSDAAHEEHKLRGLAASKGVYEGPARRVSHPSEFDRVKKGDVLVTASTSEAFNILLPLLGAIVTDSGGLLSHSAIVAREYGIPGVVGTRQATDRIADGARVRVDGDRGEVTFFG